MGCNKFDRNVEEKDWERLEEKLPVEFRWIIQGAKRIGNRGRAAGGG